MGKVAEHFCYFDEEEEDWHKRIVLEKISASKYLIRYLCLFKVIHSRLQKGFFETSLIDATGFSWCYCVTLTLR